MESTPATLAELKAKFPKSSAEWRESQLEAGASLSDAAIAYAAHVEAKAEAAQAAHAKQIEDMKASAAPLKGVALGHDPIVDRGGKQRQQADDDYIESGEPIDDFNAAVAKVAGPNSDLTRRHRAIRTVANRQPELYEAYLLATNTGKRQTRLIQEKLETSRS